MTSIRRDPKNTLILVVKTPFDRGVVNNLKMVVPYTDRTWDPARKAWLMSEHYGQAVEDIITARWPSFVSGLTHTKRAPEREDRVIRLEYIGTTRKRYNGQELCFGYVDDKWSYIFPRNVVEEFFTGFVSAQPDKSTLYSLLQVQQNATEKEIKNGYRRMAKIWHPDINQEPKAASMFIEIKSAYDILKIPDKRRKYDVGLSFETGLTAQKTIPFDVAANSGYRSPLTCGMLHVTITPSARSVVTKIHKWQDIVNADGKILVTSWKKDATMFERHWT